jgi:hypothetical protein
MYNLTVAIAHTFFVGEEEWLVHNVDCVKFNFVGNNITYASNLYKKTADHIKNEAKSLIEKMKAGNDNPGLGNRSLGGGFIEIRGSNNARIIVKDLSGKGTEFDVIGIFEGHAKGHDANSKIINTLIEEYKKHIKDGS